jgi:hypothetical protein
MTRTDELEWSILNTFKIAAREGDMMPPLPEDLLTTRLQRFILPFIQLLPYNSVTLAAGIFESLRVQN